MLECVLQMEGAFDQTKVKKKEMGKIVLASHTREHLFSLASNDENVMFKKWLT